jgi:hypothetical protein
MRIDGMPNVIMASESVQALAQSEIFQSALARQATSLRMHEELLRSHTQIAEVHAAQKIHDAGVLDPDQDPHDNEGQPPHHQPSTPGRPGNKAKEKPRGGFDRPSTGRIIDLSA